jgi:uridine kinase
MSQNDNLMQAVRQIELSVQQILQEKNCAYIAIDGRCAAGKSTLAAALEQVLGCHVAHMDDFFLRPEQRTQERLSKPGENVDHERFLEEVLLPYRKGEEFSYRAYDCHKLDFKDPIHLIPGKIFVVEGAYSCRDSLWDFYDLHIFLDVEPKLQLERIKARNGKDAAKRFEEMWIPLEEAYFSSCDIQKKCEMVFNI